MAGPRLAGARQRLRPAAQPRRPWPPGDLVPRPARGKSADAVLGRLLVVVVPCRPLLLVASLGPRRDRVAQSQPADHCFTGDRQRSTGSGRICGSGAAPKPRNIGGSRRGPDEAGPLPPTHIDGWAPLRSPLRWRPWPGRRRPGTRFHLVSNRARSQECMHGPGAPVVGDGLVPSRSEFTHEPHAGDHKGRPYESRAKSPARRSASDHSAFVPRNTNQRAGGSASRPFQGRPAANPAPFCQHA